MSYFMKEPCAHCPFRRDVKPFLHPERAYDIASAAQNQFSSFTCHKTLEHDGESLVIAEKSKECAGFLTLRAQFGLPTPEDFAPAFEKCYEDELDMEHHHQEAWEKDLL